MLLFSVSCYSSEVSFLIKTTCGDGICTHLVLDVNEKVKKVYVRDDSGNKQERLKQIKEIISQYERE